MASHRHAGNTLNRKKEEAGGRMSGKADQDIMQLEEHAKQHAVAVKDVASDVMKPLVVGYTGETFCKRPVVLVKKEPGIFGTSGGRARLERFTLHNGIVNHCDIGSGGKPSPYWAVLDAASDLHDKFTKEQIVERAVKTLGEDTPDIRKACSFAWDVLKTHMRHKTKRDVGMSHMVDHVDGRHTMSIRGRRQDETLEFFMAGKEPVVRSKVSVKQRKVAVVAKVPASVEAEEPHPAEHERPLKTVVVKDPS
jgi:hypothetical protein